MVINYLEKILAVVVDSPVAGSLVVKDSNCQFLEKVFKVQKNTWLMRIARIGKPNFWRRNVAALVAWSLMIHHK